jgi:hypothetical protein
MATFFPANPMVNQEYNGYKWNGEAWRIINVEKETAQDNVAELLTHTNHQNITVTYDDANNKVIFTGFPQITQEEVQDFLAPLFTHGTNSNITATYDDVSNKMMLEAIIPPSKAYMSVMAPVNPIDGQLWYDTDESRAGLPGAIKVWNALTSQWVYLSADLAKSTTNTWTANNTFNNGVIIGLSFAPTSPVEGQIYYNTILDKLKVFDGNFWQDIQGSGGGGGGLSLTSTDLTVPPSTFFVGLIAPPVGATTEGDLWIDVDDDAGETEFIFAGPEAPENYGTDTLWIDTDEPISELIYSADEPATPSYQGELWIDTDDTSGQSILSAITPPSPAETDFWLDLTTEEGFITYKDLFFNGAAQVTEVVDLPVATLYPGMISYVISNQSLYVSTGGEWKKIYPNYDAESISWMGF